MYNFTVGVVAPFHFHNWLQSTLLGWIGLVTLFTLLQFELMQSMALSSAVHALKRRKQGLLHKIHLYSVLAGKMLPDKTWEFLFTGMFS